MTPKEIREIIATRLMGWHKEKWPILEPGDRHFMWVQSDGERAEWVTEWRPCKRVLDAMKVLKVFVEKCGGEVWAEIRSPYMGALWICRIRRAALYTRSISASAPTFERAVCEAIARFLKESEG